MQSREWVWSDEGNRREVPCYFRGQNFVVRNEDRVYGRRPVSTEPLRTLFSIVIALT